MKDTSPPLLTCRKCGNQHYGFVNCSFCKEPTPHYVVLKGGAK
jgi:hypothetical protein